MVYAEASVVVGFVRKPQNRELRSLQQSVRELFVIVAIVVSTAVVAVHYCTGGLPYRSARIVEGRDAPEATRYAEEFAELLSVSTHWNTGEPLNEPIFYFPSVSGDLRSPDGAVSLSQRNLENSYHEITLSRSAGTAEETILVLQESDPGSGISHGYRWSHDSKAVFIYGSGKPAGHPLMHDMALIYLVEQRALFPVDLGPFLANRIKRTRGTQNETHPTVERMRLAVASLTSVTMLNNKDGNPLNLSAIDDSNFRTYIFKGHVLNRLRAAE